MNNLATRSFEGRWSGCLVSGVLLACACAPPGPSEPPPEKLSPALNSNLWWSNGHVAHKLGFVINPQVILNHDNDQIAQPWAHDSSYNPFGFVVYWRVQSENATSSTAAPTMTVSPTSNGETVLCQENGVVGGCAKPTVNSYCSCEVKNALPGQLYTYSVFYDGIQNWQAKVKTRPPKGDATPISFNFYSDVHDQVEPVKALIDNFAADSPDFAIFGGDMSDCAAWGGNPGDNLGNVDTSLNAQALSGLLSSLPVFGAVGNHEYHRYCTSGGEMYGGWPTLLKMYVGAPDTDTPTYAGKQYAYYSFAWGQTHFVFLNGGFMNDFCRACGCWQNGHGGECPNEYSSFDNNQFGWLYNDLNDASKDPQIKHIIAVIHQTPYNRVGDDSNEIPVITDLLSKFGVQAVIGGHNHSYNHVVKDGVQYLTMGASCDPSYNGNGNSDADVLAWRASGDWFGYGKFTVNGDVMTSVENGTGLLWDQFDFSVLSFGRPSALTVSVNENLSKTLDLSWNPPTGVVGVNYDVWQSVNNGPWSQIKETQADVTHYSVGNQVIGGKSAYRVRGHNLGNGFYSEFTNVVTVKFPYDPITGLAYFVYPNSVKLTWYPYVGAGGLPLAYGIYRRAANDPDGDAAYELFDITDPAITQATDYAPPPGKAMLYKVVGALTSGGDTDAAIAAFTTAPGAATASKIKMLLTPGQGPSVAQMFWNNDASGFDHLVVQRSTDSGMTWQSIYTGASGVTDTNSYTDTSAPTGMSNYYRVGYADAQNNTTYSTPSVVSVPAPSPAPLYIWAIQGTNNLSVASSWGANLPDHVSLYRRPTAKSPVGTFREIARVPGVSQITDVDGHCGVSYDYYLAGWYYGSVSSPSNIITAASACPTTNACATGTPGDTFSANMQGCNGSVTWDNRDNLCAPGFRPCSANDWAANHFAQPPHHDYWTNDNLQYTGTGPNACDAVTAGGNVCSTSDNRPMRVCTASGNDAEGNTCTWTGCGLTATNGNQYFGGCVANQNAGTLCCRDNTDGYAQPTVAAGYQHTCALLDDGTTRCWGSDVFGQLGLADGNANGSGGATGQMGDNLPALNLGTRLAATELAAGTYHTCAALNDGSVKCWGYNGYGQLGLGDMTARGLAPGSMGDALPVVSLGNGRRTRELKAGSYHNCAILDNNTLKCWGWNGYGGLGLGDTISRGAGGGQMGDSLPAVSLGDGRSPRAIGIGYGHTCAVLDNGQLKCWGYNGYGQLGLGDTNSRGGAPNQMGSYLPAISLGTARTALAVAAGAYHTCALLDNGQVKCWGYNGYGQLGLGDTNNRGIAANQMGDSLPAVALGTGRSAIAITASAYGACAVLDDHSVKCWGYNGDGGLGLGDTNNRGSGPNQMGDSLPAVDLAGIDTNGIAGGWYHTCAILATHALECWGDNDAGQLGLGDASNRGDAAGEMGLTLHGVNLGLDRNTLR